MTAILQTKWTYEDRLLISIIGNTGTQFFTRSGLLVACGYERIEIGGRGPYLEFNDYQIQKSAIFIPESEEWRLNSPDAYYHEWRTRQDYVKLYYQRKTVDYANYRIGFWYVSPFDLYLPQKQLIIQPLRREPLDLFED